MNVSDFQRLFDYNYWAHRRVWEFVLPLTDEQFAFETDYSLKSVHRQVVHTMAIEEIWLARANGISPERLPYATEYPNRAVIRAKWDTVETDWRHYLNTLRDEDLSKQIDFFSLNPPTPRTMLHWEILMQVVNHGTDHRAQTLALIHQVGGKTIDQDFYVFASENLLL